MSVRSKPLRWRRLTGRRYGPDAYGLFRAGVQLATAQEASGGKWFWYGQGRNTANRPASIGAVQLEASSYIREIGL